MRFVAVKRVQRASRPARQTWCFARISSTVRPRTAETSVAARVASEGAFSRAVRTTASGPFAVVSERRGVPDFGRSKRAGAAGGEVEDLGGRVGRGVELEDEGPPGRRRPRRPRPSRGRRRRGRSPSRTGRRRAAVPSGVRALALRPSRFTSPARRAPRRSRRGTPAGSASGAATTGASTPEKRAARSRSAPAPGTSGAVTRRGARTRGRRPPRGRRRASSPRRRGRGRGGRRTRPLPRREAPSHRAGRALRPPAGGRGPRCARKGSGTSRSRRPSSGGSGASGCLRRGPGSERTKRSAPCAAPRRAPRPGTSESAVTASASRAFSGTFTSGSSTRRPVLRPAARVSSKRRRTRSAVAGSPVSAVRTSTRRPGAFTESVDGAGPEAAGAVPAGRTTTHGVRWGRSGGAARAGASAEAERQREEREHHASRYTRTGMRSRREPASRIGRDGRDGDGRRETGDGRSSFTVTSLRQGAACGAVRPAAACCARPTRFRARCGRAGGPRELLASLVKHARGPDPRPVLANSSGSPGALRGRLA